MTKQDWIESLLFSGFRLLAFSLLLFGALSLVFQLSESWFQFDPNYFSEFFMSTVFRPIVLILTGALVHFSSRRLAGSMAASFSRTP